MRSQAIAFLLLIMSWVAGAQTYHSAQGSFTSSGKSIVIERFDPEIKGSHAAVLLVHGSGGPDGGWRKSNLIEALTEAGYSVFAPHYFDGAGIWSPSDHVEKFFAYIRTLNDATRYLAGQPGVRAGGIGVVGFSLGGYLVLGLAEEEFSHPPPEGAPPIKAVVEMYGGMPDFAASRLTTMPPVLILHGEKDQVVPVSQAHDLAALLDKKKLPYEMKIYSNQEHGFSGADLKDANGRTAAFLKAHLQ